jgi:NADH-quinone oxidoreductase subunit D
MTPHLWGFEEREKLMEFYERASGARLHAAYFRPGGVHQDLPQGSARGYRSDFCETVPKKLDDIETLLTENRIFKQRTVDIGIVTAEEAMDWGMSGADAARLRPCLGICVNRSPMTFMTDMDFDVPVGKTGDCYDRYI